MTHIDDTWSVIDSYFKTNPYFLSRHHLDSYNDFVSNRTLQTVRALNPIIVIKNQEGGKLQHEVEVYVGGTRSDEIYLTKPTIVENNEQRIMYPNEARLKDFTYQAEMYANILIRYITKESGTDKYVVEKVFDAVKIGAIPIMLHSKLCVLHDTPPDVRREMGECKWDQGGYFIIDGKEKVIVSQERIATNRLFVTKSKDPKYSYEGLIRCTSEENPLFPKVVMFYVNNTKTIDPTKEKEKEGDAEEATDQVPKASGKDKRIHNSIMVTLPYFSEKVPLFVLFRALGVETDKDILQHIFHNLDEGSKAYLDFMYPSVLAGSNYGTVEESLEYMANFVEYKSVENVKKILSNDVFPNIGQSLRDKAVFLAHIVMKLVNTCLGVARETDRDSYIYKRVDISGFLLGNIFRDYYNQFRNVIRNNLDNQYLYGPWRNSKTIETLVNPSNMSLIFNPDIIEGGMKKSLKGMWGMSMVGGSSEHVKQGLVQDLSRISYLGFTSHLRRVSTPIDPTSKVVAPHHLHPTQWGIMCPCESPDGASIGLLKNFAIMCQVTFDVSSKDVLKHMRNIGMTYVQEREVTDMYMNTKVLVNSSLIGFVKDDPFAFTKTLKLLKLNGIIYPFTSVSWNISTNEIHVLTEAGRCCRPVYVVQKGKLVIDRYVDKIKSGEISWNDFFKSKSFGGSYDISALEESMSPIEYIDVEESNNALLAMYPEDLKASGGARYTHCEIHPSTILSVLTLNIPLSQHNQAPRNIFSGAQGKQAIGIYATNFNDRIDTMAYLLHYPQRSLVNTRYMQYMHNNDMPNGENLIVAIATYTGYNQEDSIIINKNSIERGCFNLTSFKDMLEKEEKGERDAIVFMNTLNAVKNEGVQMSNLRLANYKKIDEHGLPKVNSRIQENDIIFGKCTVTSELVEEESVMNIFNTAVKKEKYTDCSVIADKTTNKTVDKVFLYVDKNEGRACKVRFRKMRTPELGDKLCSRTAQKGVIGMIIPQENMPFNSDGVVPDVIINPHAFPTRMTLGHLIECLIAKVGVNVGSCIDGTPFSNTDYSDLFTLLENKYGLESTGNEILYNGFNGRQMECSIFFGPTYYERLKHMVADKINYRTTGPITNKTRQPTQGRGNGGGLRIGEMERDSVLAHGATAFLKESLMERSDIYEFAVDKETGFIADRPGANSRIVKTPCAFRLLMQEVAAMGVKPQLLFEDVIEEGGNDDAEVNACMGDIDGVNIDIEGLDAQEKFDTEAA